MARRIIFRPTSDESNNLFQEVLIDFLWVPGMAISQARKSVQNLHASAIHIDGISKMLEISTRSLDQLGISLSAFNLEINHNDRKYPVEVVYQASKIFSNGGPYLDLLSSSSLDAKRDSRLKDSGELMGFSFEKSDWPVSTSPNFYDYLYIRALLGNPRRAELLKFDAFSDIAFSQITLIPKPGKSYNCQARSAAIYISLLQRMDESKILNWILPNFKTIREVNNQPGLF